MSERKRPLRVLGYARVSSREQGIHGTSLEAQQEELARYCSRLGYPAPALFVEVESGSGKAAEKRTEQLKIMAQLRAGDLVLVAKQDRWSRDVLHCLASMQTIRKLGADITSVVEGFATDTAAQRLQVTNMAAFSEYERAVIYERTQSARARLRAMGCHVDGHPPLGYRLEARHLVVVPEQAEKVRNMFAAYLAGDTTRTIAERMDTDHAAIARRLRDRRYLGEVPATPFRVSGKDIPTTWIASHDPIVERHIFDATQEALRRRRLIERSPGATSRNVGYLLRSLARCGACGHVLIAHRVAPGASVRHDGWYACRYRPKCNGPRARKDRVDAKAEEMMLTHLESIVDLLTKPPRSPRTTPKFREERTVLERRRERLIEAVADGALSPADVRKKMAECDAALSELEARRVAWEREQRMVRPEVRAEALRDVKRLRRAWSKMRPDERREVFLLHAERVEIHSTQRRKWERDAWDLRVKWKK
jgi:DNA invertase Pin-like site-specific DNA recombinase